MLYKGAPTTSPLSSFKNFPRFLILIGTILSPIQSIMKEMNKPWRENCLPDPINRREQGLRVLEQDTSGRRFRVPKKVEGKL